MTTEESITLRKAALAKFERRKAELDAELVTVNEAIMDLKDLLSLECDDLEKLAQLSKAYQEGRVVGASNYKY